MSHLIHVANVLILVSFCVKEILWLRILSIIASRIGDTRRRART